MNIELTANWDLGNMGDSLHLGVSQNGNIWCILHQVLNCSTEVYPHLATMLLVKFLCNMWLSYHVISPVFHIQSIGVGIDGLRKNHRVSSDKPTLCGQKR